ncbi:Oidioi.mRNA.OKI2018_I69.chr1.g2143.t1.cds [Oikopleura dioica]|uniref:Oidioi.mRNA.OKI2018_I69.chr1.g2143.t1.cds n=1 Tax=Oikopleura dioica TaxID=34765 RepID=A0ABN7SQ66_OIKDI|nr:Oidioi.mRNA.OKI2018_I69.chr1.g2143.t1.cds [Oikopleura dioica]
MQEICPDDPTTNATLETTVANNVDTTRIITTAQTYDPFNSVFGFLTTTTDPTTTLLTTLTTVTTTAETTTSVANGISGTSTPAVAEGSEEITQVVPIEANYAATENDEITIPTTTEATIITTAKTAATTKAIPATAAPIQTTTESLDTTTSGCQSLPKSTTLLIPLALYLSSFL